MKILGIETSCDEAGVALVSESGEVIGQELLSHVKACQPHGGILPEVVAREHMGVLPVLVKNVIQKAGLSLQDIGAVAVTTGPGLISSLLIGCSYARGLALALGCPIYGVNHLQAHVLVARLQQKIAYPTLALLISGGHTILYYVAAPHVFRLVGNTKDDAVGEVFDKVARMLGFPYPGGVHIEKVAKSGKPCIDFPRPMLKHDNLDFSFSGLKAAVARYLEKYQASYVTEDVAASFQMAVTDTLSQKVARALREYPDVRSVVVTGGVAANQAIRSAVQGVLPSHVEFCAPAIQLCTDNGVMSAYAAFELLRYGVLQKGENVVANPNYYI